MHRDGHHTKKEQVKNNEKRATIGLTVVLY